jgi:hypothetical protein
VCVCVGLLNCSPKSFNIMKRQKITTLGMAVLLGAMLWAVGLHDYSAKADMGMGIPIPDDCVSNGNEEGDPVGVGSHCIPGEGWCFANDCPVGTTSRPR